MGHSPPKASKLKSVNQS